MNKDITDLILEQKIDRLQANVKAWAEARGMWKDSRFKTYQEHFNQEPNEYGACVTVLVTEGPINSMMNAYSHFDEMEAFDKFIETEEFYYECNSNCVYCFYPADDALNEQYLRYFEWQWICELIKPDYTGLYQEIFDYFQQHPGQFYNLSPRKFEILVSEIFRNQGYRTELGKGQGDGGIDVKLFKKDEIDQIVTLVQVKKYKPGLPIQLDAVAALTAIVDQEKANRGLFVTTSRYLPVAQRFAAREQSKLTLADAKDVSRWCEEARNVILRDKSALFTDRYLLDLVKSGSRDDYAGKILHADTGYGMIANEFCLVIKDTPHVALLMRLPRTATPTDQPYNTIGYEIPVLDDRMLACRNKENVFRAQKHHGDDGRVRFWGGGHSYYLWDCKPQYFDHND